MKRSKEDEKSMEPMFPRLHVNDTTEKGGPRAPPRNKMALYEQLSIPSQRFNHGVLPLNISTMNSNNSAPHGSSSRGSVPERNVQFPPHVPASTSAHVPASTSVHVPERFASGGEVMFQTPLGQLEQRKKIGDEDDFRVPVFVQSEMNKDNSKTCNEIDVVKHAPSSETFLGHSMKIRRINGNHSKQNNSRGVSSINDVENQMREIPTACVSNKDHSLRFQTNFTTEEKSALLGEEVNASLDQHQLHLEANQGSVPGSQPNDSGCSSVVPELIRAAARGGIDKSRRDLHSREDHICPSEPEINSENRGNNTHHLVGEKSDDVSETSIVDSASALDISPDDVADIIGQKHFFQARRIIVNQQRVFAVQVFELHRLIKVQRLIAGSPDLLHEDGSFVDKPSGNNSPAKKLPSDHAVIPLVHKHKDDSEKQNYKTEFSAENAVGKASASSVKNVGQPPTYGPYAGNPIPVTAGADPKMVPWCYPSSMGHQWLIPVMSPSEGLIYKPCMAPSYTGSICGGCGPGPYGPSPFSGNYINQAYAAPTHPHHNHQGVGVPMGASPVAHGYFPPYGMQMMNQPIPGSVMEQMNYFARTDSQGQSGQLSGGGANITIQHQNSCNMPIQKGGGGAGIGASPQVKKLQPSRDTELQGSTASSPSERVQGAGTTQVNDARDAILLFPVSSDAPAESSSHPEPGQPTRVIRVVPHNPSSATESAARIFQSIQEERKQYDSL